jgi:hypothetical protein
MAIDPSKWLLTPSSSGDGKPWGTGTKMAARALDPSAAPWDVGCRVTTLVGGYAAMSAMRDALETVIAAAKASTAPAGSRGHVYLANWRFNCQRDLSSNNSWTDPPWNASGSSVDQTTRSACLRLTQAQSRRARSCVVSQLSRGLSSKAVAACVRPF